MQVLFGYLSNHSVSKQMIRFCTFLLIIATFFSREAKAGLFICNDTGTELNVAVGWVMSGNLNSHGWWIVEPRDCALPIDGPLAGGYYYYYAYGGDMIFGGDGSKGFFCADHQNKFDYQYTQAPNCDGYSFYELNVGDSQVWTQSLTETVPDPTTAAFNCHEQLNDQLAFAKCWTRQVATSRERQILDCVDATNTGASLGVCISKGFIGDDEKRTADCVLQYNQDKKPLGLVECLNHNTFDSRTEAAMNCAIENGNNGGVGATMSCLLGTQMSPEQRRIFNCMAANANDYRATAVCIGVGQLSPDQQRIANCVMQNASSYMQMGVCAAGSNLTPEQQVFASCAITSGGQPYVFAGCVGTQLTVNELQKCFTQGIGGDGCFGNNNTAVKFVSNAWKDVTKGPGPSNDLVGRDGFVVKTLENARKDVEQGPGPSNDLVGRDGFVCKKVLFGICK